MKKIRAIKKSFFFPLSIGLSFSFKIIFYLIVLTGGWDWWPVEMCELCGVRRCQTGPGIWMLVLMSDVAPDTTLMASLIKPDVFWLFRSDIFTSYLWVLTIEIIRKIALRICFHASPSFLKWNVSSFFLLDTSDKWLWEPLLELLSHLKIFIEGWSLLASLMSDSWQSRDNED